MLDNIMKIQKKILRKLDTSILEIKVKGYSKELSQMYVLLGEIYYKNIKNNEEVDSIQVEEIIDNIDSLKNRIKNLSKHILEIREAQNVEPEQKSQSETKEQKNYAKLSRSNDDLIIKRTEEGIRFVKLSTQETEE